MELALFMLKEKKQKDCLFILHTHSFVFSNANAVLASGQTVIQRFIYISTNRFGQEQNIDRNTTIVW